jgi:prefoldin subunit 5
MLDNNKTKRPIETLADADKVITDLRRENKNLRRQRNDLQAKLDAKAQECAELKQQLARQQ